MDDIQTDSGDVSFLSGEASAWMAETFNEF